MRLLALLPLAAVCSCAPKSATRAAQCAPAAGEGRLAVNGGRIWYKVSGTGHGMPVVLLHGGPGLSSYYLKPLEALGNDRIVIRYDQLGSGKSDTTSDTTLFTIPHFVAGLDSLRSFFHCAQWDVLGHSWGTVLALEYYRAHPGHVHALVFESPLFDAPAYVKHADSLLATLPDSTQRVLRHADSTDDEDTPAYRNALNQFYARYLFRHPIKADLDSLFTTANDAIRDYMLGRPEFVTGTLKHYVVTDFLPKVAVPTLYTVGQYDEVGPGLTKRFADLTPHAEYVEIPDAAHVTMWDNPVATIKAVRAFLRATDAKGAE